MTTYKKRRFALLASSLLILGLTAGLEARPRVRAFAATLEGFAGPMPTADPCILANNGTGTGHALHMGAITSVWQNRQPMLEPRRR